ncbi:MAG TPA: hypothetical protein VFK54_07630 [Candidatus Limnocylindrales bacterium]|nr:hypothetical protein [Candidatus Limnocylindrales bacterium]
MPADLLLPLLALALLVNGVLVAVAVRQLVMDARGSKLSRVAEPARVAEPVRADPARSPDRWWPETGWKPEYERPPARRRPTGARPADPQRGEAAGQDPVAQPVADAAAGPPPTTPRPARRRSSSRPRRFTLPPETEDRERADRAIDLFLSGGRVDSPSRPHPRVTAGAMNGERRATGDTRTASVAIVAIAGYRTLAEDDPGRERADAVAEAVETTLRRSARSDDHIVSLGDGRFRILLMGTAEPAAQAYLERIRAACTPWLSVAGIPLDLVTAAAQAGPDGDLSRALRTAERRLGRAAGGTDLERDAGA